MGRIVIECPSTGKEVNTGMGMDKQSFQSSNMSNNSVKCPHCGQMHSWDKKDAKFKED